MKHHEHCIEWICALYNCKNQSIPYSMKQSITTILVRHWRMAQSNTFDQNSLIDWLID
jgi:hypothetical protein